MEDFQQRVVQEEGDLNSKIERLTVFLKSGGKAQALPDAEWNRLIEQRRHMQRYLDVLRQRMAAF